MKRLIKEPLFHFLLLGGLLFAVAAWRAGRQTAPAGDAVSSAVRIEVTAATINTLRAQWTRQYQRPPSVEELRGLVDDHVREQVLYREALALGLDRDDSIVRRRLAQKMEFLSADIFEAAAPDDAGLQRFLDENADRYARPARITFRHVYFSPQRRGVDAAPAAARAALAALAQPGTSDESFGDPFVGEFEFTDRGDREIADAFGKEFAADLIDAPASQWVGPITSSYGLHLVRVSHRATPQKVQLADVRDAVARDYQEQRRRDANRDIVDRLRQRYEISIDQAALNSATSELMKTRAGDAMTRRPFIVVCAALALLLLSAASARAHEVRPAFLELTEKEPGRFDVVWKVPVLGQGTPLAGDETSHESDAPATIDPNAPKTMPCGCPTPWSLGLTIGAMPLHPVLPQHAKAVAPPRLERVIGAEIRRWTIDAGPRGLDGWTCVVHGLASTSSDVLVRVALLDGAVVTRVLRPDAPSFTFAAAAAAEEGIPVAAYLRLGVEHILMGIDHLLFVAGLLLLVRGFGRLVKTITAFTVAHTVTLSLATLGVVHIPSGPVEAVIALSIVFVAREIVQQWRGAEPSLAVRQPWLVAFTFGLLHGFGFAGALGEVGLPPGEIPLALLLFSVGVEIGHFAFVAVVLALVALCRRTRFAAARWAYPIPAYGIGTVAAFWLVMRVVAI